MTSIEKYYDAVLKDNFDLLYKRHEKFPDIVMTCALIEYRYDVVKALLKKNIKVNYDPLFKFKWVRDKSTLLGISQQNLESDEDLEKKFKMVSFLLEHKVLDESIIPKYLIPQWYKFKGIKIGEKKPNIIAFLFILVSIIVSICLSFAL